MKNTTKKLTAREFDDKFDSGEDISEFVDWSAASKQVNLDLPLWALKRLDLEANRRGVARQALMKMWIVDRLDSLEVSAAKVTSAEKKAV